MQAAVDAVVREGDDAELVLAVGACLMSRQGTSAREVALRCLVGLLLLREIVDDAAARVYLALRDRDPRVHRYNLPPLADFPGSIPRQIDCSMTDGAARSLFGLGRHALMRLLHLVVPLLQRRSRGPARARPPEERVLLFLSFLRGKGPGKQSARDGFNTAESSASVYRREVMVVLLDALRRDPRAAIVAPTAEQLEESTVLSESWIVRWRERRRLSLVFDPNRLQDEPLVGVSMEMDGSPFKICHPTDDDVQEAHYCGGKYRMHCVKTIWSNLFTGEFVFIANAYAGAAHDSNIAGISGLYGCISDISLVAQAGQPGAGRVVGRVIADSAFRKSRRAQSRFAFGGRTFEQLEGRQNVVVNTTRSRTNSDALDRQVRALRQSVEWAVRAVKGVWCKAVSGDLRVGRTAESAQRVADLIEVCFLLTNWRARVDHVNQLWSVFADERRFTCMSPITGQFEQWRADVFARVRRRFEHYRSM